MRAVIVTAYGDPDVLALREVEKPSPAPGQILIRVRATTVTAGDCQMRAFRASSPFMWVVMRLYLGIRKPRRQLIPGMEMAGEVEAIGDGVTRFAVGDRVFGSALYRLGTYAEYVCLSASRCMAVMPDALDFGEAAAVPTGALNALHFMREAKIQPGERVLIYGASGSMGTFAVQLARHFRADVTAVAGPSTGDLMKSLGASTVFDYTKDDFAAGGAKYDVVFDPIGRIPYDRCIDALAEGGRYLQGDPTPMLKIRGMLTSATSSKKVIYKLANEKTKDLLFLKDLIEAGELKTIIDRRYPLEEIVAAHRYVDQRVKVGNVVIDVAGPRAESPP